MDVWESSPKLLWFFYNLIHVFYSFRKHCDKIFSQGCLLNNGTEYNLFIITAYNDGIQKELFTLDGTIPVKFRGTYDEWWSSSCTAFTSLVYWNYSCPLMVCTGATLPFLHICLCLAMTWMLPQKFPICFSSFSIICCHVIFGLDTCITKLWCSRKYQYTPVERFWLKQHSHQPPHPQHHQQPTKPSGISF